MYRHSVVFAMQAQCGGTGAIALDAATIVANNDTGRLDNNVFGATTAVGGDGFGGLVLEP